MKNSHKFLAQVCFFIVFLNTSGENFPNIKPTRKRRVISSMSLCVSVCIIVGLKGINRFRCGFLTGKPIFLWHFLVSLVHISPTVKVSALFQNFVTTFKHMITQLPASNYNR